MEIKKDNLIHISFSWDIHYKCNYRCPYCWWHGRWQDISKFNQYLSVQELLRCWNNIYNKYGSVHIELLGGEPFIYPNFNELIFELSKIHTLGITTNLSTNIDDFAQRLDSSKVKIMPTFHPAFADFDTFLGKVKVLKQKGFSSHAYYLAYPPQIGVINFYKEKFAKEDISLLIMTFWGKYNGMEYPAGYTQEEINIIKGALAKRCDEEYQITPKNDFKGKLCNAGKSYGVIHPDGKVVRCGGSGLDEVVGFFFDDNFQLSNKALPCKAESCKCNEWVFLLDKQRILDCDKASTTKANLANFVIPVDNPSLVFLNVQETVNTKVKRISKIGQVEFSWEICYTCNYRCPYCGRWNDESGDDLKLDVEEWKHIWERIYEKYGSCNMYISGAEPTTYHKFFDIIQRISDMHTITICTNFSWDAIEILDRNINPERVQFTPTFHSLFSDFDIFLEKAVRLRDWIRNKMVFFVAYQMQMDKVNYYKNRVNENGLNFSIVPLRGCDVKGKVKVIITQEEKDKISAMTDMHKDEFEYLAQNKSPKGKPCLAGYSYAIIKPTGKVFPCSQSDCFLGYIYSDDFGLLEEPIICPSGFCPYESHNLVERYEASHGNFK